MNWLKQLLELISAFVKVAGYKDGMQKSIVLKCISNKTLSSDSLFLEIHSHTYPSPHPGFVDINWKNHAVILVCMPLIYISISLSRPSWTSAY